MPLLCIWLGSVYAIHTNIIKQNNQYPYHHQSSKEALLIFQLISE